MNEKPFLIPLLTIYILFVLILYVPVNNFPVIFPLLQIYGCILTLLSTCLLLITFTNSLDSDQDRQIVCPDLNPICLTLYGVPEEFFFEKVDFEKNQQTTKNPIKDRFKLLPA